MLERNISQRIALGAALLTLAIHLAWNANYGFFRDELYFIICGRHPALGYVDQPSLTPLLAALSQTFGISLFALRAVPAVCGALATYIACIFTAELGGKSFAVALSGLVTLVSPEMMAFALRLSPDMIEFWAWPLIALLVLRLVRGAEPRSWLWVGLLLAVAAWSKYSVAFFAVGLLLGLLLTPQRRVLWSWWFAAGVVLAAVLVLPSVLWQWQYHFPMIQLLRNDYGKFLLRSPPFVIQQVMVMSPLLSIVWLVGLGALLIRAETRFLGIAYIALIAMMWALDAKAYYPAPVYPYLIAAGAVPFERWSSSRSWLRTAIFAAIVAFAIPSTPFVLPVLPLQRFIQYQETLGRIFGIRFHVDRRAGNDIPIQYFADMTGWPELTQTVASIYGSLPKPERSRAAVYARNFGEASALAFFGPAYGLPQPISPNNNFWIWGPRGYSGEVVIDVNGDVRVDRARFRSVHLATVFHNPYGMPYENDLHIYVCRGIRKPLAQLWPSLRDYSYGFTGL